MLNPCVLVGGKIAVPGETINAFLLVYATLFPIVDPVGAAPIFAGLTRRWTDPERHALALRVAHNGFFLLLGALFAGSYALQLFGITLAPVRVGGGILVVAFAWNLLNTDHLSADHLIMPPTVGPGSIAVAITLGSQWSKGASDVVHLVSRFVALMRLSERQERRQRETLESK